MVQPRGKAFLERSAVISLSFLCLVRVGFTYPFFFFSFTSFFFIAASFHNRRAVFRRDYIIRIGLVNKKQAPHYGLSDQVARRDSTMFIREARTAGRTPPTNPITREKIRARYIISKERVKLKASSEKV